MELKYMVADGVSSIHHMHI